MSAVCEHGEKEADGADSLAGKRCVVVDAQFRRGDGGRECEPAERRVGRKEMTSSALRWSRLQTTVRMKEINFSGWREVWRREEGKRWEETRCAVHVSGVVCADGESALIMAVEFLVGAENVLGACARRGCKEMRTGGQLVLSGARAGK